MKIEPTYYTSVDIGPLINIELESPLHNLVAIMENLKLVPNTGAITPFFDFRELIPV